MLHFAAVEQAPFTDDLAKALLTRQQGAGGEAQVWRMGKQLIGLLMVAGLMRLVQGRCVGKGSVGKGKHRRTVTFP